MIKLLRSPSYAKPIAWIMLLAFSVTFNGCYYYKVTRSKQPADVSLTKASESGKFLILHLEDKAWQLTHVKINGNDITGKISPLAGHNKYMETDPSRSNRYKRNELTRSNFLNEVHIYSTAFEEKKVAEEYSEIILHTTDILKIEVYEKDKGATAASWIFSAVGVTAGAFGILLVIIALTKSSCPFVYTWNGTDYQFCGEIFSGATQPSLERDDFLPLPGLKRNKEGQYDLRMTNEVNEIQMVNFAELICVDHAEDLSVLIDKYGKIRTLKNPEAPLSAVNRRGADILPSISKKDSSFYSGDEKDRAEDGIEEMVLEFPVPAGADSARLVIKARNSFWLDVLFTRFHGYFGSKYDKYSEKQSLQSGDSLRKNLLDQKLPLLLYVERAGKWEFTDYFNIAGPMAMRDDVLSFSLKGVRGDRIRIKLETGFLFWEVDYAALDVSPYEEVSTIKVAPVLAMLNDSIDERYALKARDDKYLSLGKPGDGITIRFGEASDPGQKRSLFLHTSGFYKILRDQHGRADLRSLQDFRNPGHFPQFSRETYNQVIGKQ